MLMNIYEYIDKKFFHVPSIVILQESNNGSYSRIEYLHYLNINQYIRIRYNWQKKICFIIYTWTLYLIRLPYKLTGVIKLGISWRPISFPAVVRTVLVTEPKRRSSSVGDGARECMGSWNRSTLASVFAK